MIDWAVSSAVKRTIACFATALFVLLISFSLFSGSAFAAYSDTDVAAIGDTGYPTLQAAIDAAQDGDEVILLDDVAENIRIEEKSLTLNLDGYTIEGTGTESVPVSVNGGNVTINGGTLTGGKGTRKVNYDTAWRARQPASGTAGGDLKATGAVITLERVLITGSTGNALTTVSCDLTMKNCEISGNNGNGYSVVSIEGGNASISNTVIKGNTNAYDTVAIINKAQAMMENCEVSGNSAQLTGGILLGAAIGEDYAGGLTLKESRIINNRASSIITCVGGLAIWYGTFKMEDSVIAGNRYSTSTSTHLANDILLKRWKEGSYIQKAATMPGDHSGYSWVDRDDAIYSDAITYGNIEVSTATIFSLGFTAERIETDPVAEYNGQTYTSLSKAVEDAVADHGDDGEDKVIKLLKDARDNVNVAEGVNFTGTLEIDLDGHSISPRKETLPIFTFKCTGGGTINIHDGVIRDGVCESNTYGRAGGIYMYCGYSSDAYMNLKLANVESVDHIKYHLYAVTAGTVEIDGCKFTRTDEEKAQEGTIYIQSANKVNINGSEFDGLTKALEVTDSYRSSPPDVTVEKSSFTNCSFSGGNIISIKGANSKGLFKNVEISDNRAFGSNPKNIVQLEGESSKPGSVTFENCSIHDNDAGYRNGTNNEKASLIATRYSDLTIKNTRIENNKAYRAGAILQDYGNSSILLVEDSVITGNISSGYTDKGSKSGGLCIIGKLIVKGNSAIYDNEIEKVHVQEYRANDIWVGKKSEIIEYDKDEFISAKAMVDGSYDFSNKIWKDGAVTSTQEHPAGIDSEYDRYYTMIDDGERFVAVIGDKKYRTMSEAIEDAEDGDLIELIYDEIHVDTLPLNVKKSISIDFHGHNLRLDRTLGEDTAITISDGAQLTLKNTRDERYTEGGVRRGDIKIEGDASLTVADPMGMSAIEHNGGGLTLEAVTEGGTDIRLGTSKFVTLGDSWKDEADHRKSKLNLTLSDSDLTAVNSGNNGNEHKIVENGDGSLLRLIEVAGLVEKVSKKASENDIVLFTPKAIYLSGKGNDSSSGTDPSNPVKTFEKARALLQSDPDYEGIYIVDTVHAKGTWEMSEGEIRPVMRYHGFDGIMIQTGGNLTLKNIIIDGQKDQIPEGTASMIKVVTDLSTGAHRLTIEEGTELRNNNAVNTTKNHNGQHNVHGGAILCESQGSSVVMNGGSIHDNEAFIGGGIFIGNTIYTGYEGGQLVQGSKFQMNGGVIENNRAVRKEYLVSQFNKASASGGGVEVAFGAIMEMNEGAMIRNNHADDEGGGISLGNNQDYYSKPGSYASDKNAVVTLNMKGGTIEGNSASNGGGLFVQCYTVANVYGGEFLDNEALMTGSFPRGGGVYVNGDHNENRISGELIFHNPVEMTENTADDNGGAIMTCATSLTYIRDVDGAAIHDNESEEGNQVALTSVSMSGSTGNFVRGPSYVSEFMPGGGEYDWTKGTSGNEVSREVLHSATETVFLNTDKTGDYEEMKAAAERSPILMKGNSTRSGGGAVANNGIVKIGHGYRARTDVRVVKNWDDAGKESKRPDSITVYLYCDGDKIEEAVIKADKNGKWVHTFSELPRYKADKDTGEDTENEHEYRVEEVIDNNGADDTIYKTTVLSKDDTTRDPIAFGDPQAPKDPVPVRNFEITNKAVTPWVHDPPVRKNIKNGYDEYTVFKFRLTPEEESYPMPDGKIGGIKEMEVRGAGEEEFGNIIFTEAGTYDYAITEVIPEGADSQNRYGNYRYDSTEWTVRYVVTEDNGVLGGYRVFLKDGKEVTGVETAAFENEYIGQEESVVPATTTRPTDPTDPNDPTDPDDPSDPTKPSGPTDPTGATGSSNATGATGSSDPSGPSSPSDPTGPDDPTKPDKPGRGTSTGDNTNLPLWLILMGLAAATSVTVGARKKR